MKTLFAVSLPTGNLLPGFFTPIFAEKEMFWVQISENGLKVPGFDRIYLGEEGDGPFLHILALEQNIPTRLEVVGDIKNTAESEFIDAFFDGQEVAIGPRAQLSAYLRGSLPRILQQLVDRPFTFAGVLEYIGEYELAASVKIARSLQIHVILSRFGIFRETPESIAPPESKLSAVSGGNRNPVPESFASKIRSMPRSYSSELKPRSSSSDRGTDGHTKAA